MVTTENLASDGDDGAKIIKHSRREDIGLAFHSSLASKPWTMETLNLDSLHGIRRGFHSALNVNNVGMPGSGLRQECWKLGTG